MRFLVEARLTVSRRIVDSLTLPQSLCFVMSGVVFLLERKPATTHTRTCMHITYIYTYPLLLLFH